MIIKTMEEMGVVIRTRRKKLKITQKELAMACGTGLRFIVELENGKQTLQIGKVFQVVGALGLVIEMTLPGDDETVARNP